MVVETAPSPRALVPVYQPEERLGLLDSLRKFLQPRTSLQRVPTLPDAGTGGIAIVSQNTALSRPTGAATYRAYAATPWVFAAINIRKNQIASAEWDIVPYDNERKTGGVRLQNRIRDLFDQPSQKLDSFQSWTQTLIDDLLTLDAGVCEKVRYPDGEIAELWPVRGEWIAVDERWDGAAPDRPRYYFVPDGTVRASFTNDDMMYMIANPRANSAVGLSPMAVLATVVDSELRAMEYNRRQVMGAPPEVVLNIGEDADQPKVIEARSYWESNILGQQAMGIIGGFKNPSIMKLRDSNQDMQYREWVDLLIRCIAVTMGLAPMDLGITFDVNRSTAEQGAQNTDDRGLRPLMALVQRYYTREIVWDRSFGGRDNNFQFAFKSLNLNETKAKADINKVALGSVSWKNVNEARATDGRAPIGDSTDESNIFNHILVNTPKGMLDLTTQKYIGEEQLAQVAADAQVDVAEATADAKAAADLGGQEASKKKSNVSNADA